MKQIIIFLVFIPCLTKVSSQTKNVHQATIEGIFTDLQSGDSVRLRVYDEYLIPSQEYMLPYRELWVIAKKSQFHFDIDKLTKPTYICLAIGKFQRTDYNQLFYFYVVEPGDDIKIEMGKLNIVYKMDGAGRPYLEDWGISSINFWGEGSSKFQYLFDMHKREKQILANVNEQSGKDKAIQKPDQPVNDSMAILKVPWNLSKSLSYADSMYKIKEGILSQFKMKLSPISIKLFQSDLIGEIENSQLMSYIGNYHTQRFSNISNSLRDSIKTLVISIYNNRIRYKVDLSSSTLLLSRNYMNYLVSDAYYSDRTHFMEGWKFINNSYHGVLFDKVLTGYILEKFRDLNNGENVLTDALSKVKTQFYWHILNDMYDNQKVGNVAYNFVLPNKESKRIALNELKGKLVFIDFWFTGCGACQTFYKSTLSKIENDFESNNNIVFITISIDKDETIWKKSLKESIYTSNANNVINLYTDKKGIDHPLIRAFNVVSYPRPILIDPNGKIYRVNNLQTDTASLHIIINQALEKFGLY